MQLAPRISDMVINVPGKINTAVIGKLKQQLKLITDLSIPDAPDNIETPEQLPTCPNHSS